MSDSANKMVTAIRNREHQQSFCSESFAGGYPFTTAIEDFSLVSSWTWVLRHLTHQYPVSSAWNMQGGAQDCVFMDFSRLWASARARWTKYANRLEVLTKKTPKLSLGRWHGHRRCELVEILESSIISREACAESTPWRPPSDALVSAALQKLVKETYLSLAVRCSPSWGTIQNALE